MESCSEHDRYCTWHQVEIPEILTELNSICSEYMCFLLVQLCLLLCFITSQIFSSLINQLSSSFPAKSMTSFWDREMTNRCGSHHHYLLPVVLLLVQVHGLGPSYWHGVHDPIDRGLHRDSAVLCSSVAVYALKSWVSRYVLTFIDPKPVWFKKE